MSRYDLPTNSVRNSDYMVVVGWDAPLFTLFAIVYDTTKPSGESEHGKIILWRGTIFREIQTIKNLQEILLKYAIIPQIIRDNLYRDMD